jgi:hypothetical protein
MYSETHNADDIFGTGISGFESTQRFVFLKHNGQGACEFFERGFVVCIACTLSCFVIKALHVGIQEQSRLIKVRKRLSQVIPAPFCDVLKNSFAYSVRASYASASF